MESRTTAMTPEDTNKIVAAIDRNTKMLWTLDQTLWLVFCCLLFIGMMTCSAGAAKASPITHAPIAEHPLQYWHTQWIPTGDGVYPLEVFAPALPRIEPEPYVFVDIGDSPRLMETPEPGTWVLTGMSFGCLVGYVVIIRRLQRKAKRYRKALHRIADHGCHELSREMAREALEEK